MKTPDFQGTLAGSFSYPYASSLRNSQVFVKRRALASLSRTPLKWVRGGMDPNELGGPVTLVVSPNGQHALAASGVYTFNLTSRGIIGIRDIPDRELPHDLVALDSSKYTQGSASTWDGRPFYEPNRQGCALARRIEEDKYAAVIIQGPIWDRNTERWTETYVTLEGGLRHGNPNDVDWRLYVDCKTAVAAIGGDRATVLALDNHLLQVYAPEGNPRGEAPILVAERNIGVVATHVSIVGSNILVIAPGHPEEGSGSRLLAFTAETRPIYSLSMPFEVLQPAIAGSGTRVYLAGRGLAALDGGGVSWLYVSQEPIYASSFEDGSLAVAHGKRLEFVNTSGTVEQAFDTEEPLLAPPAIAADGTVWAISGRAVYIAR
ncbi:MAG TPA: hypothetical protein VFQ61_19115 [Polyangiaceae bacterium]|nr:hypothetical protein [Polyangiaceae bacterium]